MDARSQQHAHHDPGSARTASPPAIATDPVCGMPADIATPKYKPSFGGSTWYFCSKHCLDKFAADPGHYAKTKREPAPVTEALPGAVYTCPMHPEIQQQGPGSCPKC